MKSAQKEGQKISLLSFTKPFVHTCDQASQLHQSFHLLCWGVPFHFAGLQSDIDDSSWMESVMPRDIFTFGLL